MKTFIHPQLYPYQLTVVTFSLDCVVKINCSISIIHRNCFTFKENLRHLKTYKFTLAAKLECFSKLSMLSFLYFLLTTCGFKLITLLSYKRKRQSLLFKGITALARQFMRDRKIFKCVAMFWLEFDVLIHIFFNVYANALN